jgi:hypothetical protein
MIKDIQNTNNFRETIRKYDNKEFYRIGNNPYFDKDRVNPEFEILMRLNFISHTSIRFSDTSLKNEKSDKMRYDFILGLISPMNQNINNHFPDIETGKHTFRYCWVNEYGNSSNDVHMHILGFIKPNLDSQVYVEAFKYLKNLEERRIDGIESILTTKIEKQSGLVSYFCKLETVFGGDEYKKIEYSMGFRSILQKFYTNA